MGLAIVKHIIDAHDEKIYVESEFGVGSEFSFTLENQNSYFYLKNLGSKNKLRDLKKI